MLFGDDATQTLERARGAVAAGFRAIKCGWGPFGRSTVAADADQLHAAREGLGPEGILLVDAGQIWREDVEAAAARLPLLEAVRATWLEEPFLAHAYEAYGALSARGSIALAGGEGAHNVFMARHLIDYGRPGFVQIDCGRIGGIGPARRVADYAVERGVTYVNHTFTSHLALSASLQPFAGLADHRICEYPIAPKAVARDLSDGHILPDGNGEIVLPNAPGLGIAASPEGMRPYLVDVEIRVRGRTLYRTPDPAQT
jgi:L-alanine-DL-glutamate epimerase-like enolase superfamily enzyme